MASDRQSEAPVRITSGRVRAAVLVAALFLALAAVTEHAHSQTAAYQVYQYDSLGNLIRSWGSDGNTADFNYDPADNRTSTDVVQGAAPPPPQPPAPPRTPHYRVLGRPGHPIVVVPLSH
jgi:YD repeat-containing protein